MVALVLLWSLAVSAAPPAPPLDRTLSPYFIVESGDPRVDAMPLESTRVNVAISGAIADVSVTQTYVNEGQRPIDVRYVFPASTRAAVHGLRMKIGARAVVAKIRERDQARKEFESARRAGKSATLLEQDRPNVFTMNLSNVMPRDRVEVTLDYTEHLVATDGKYEFVYPTVVGPRYSNQPEGAAPARDRFVQTGYLRKSDTRAAAFELSGTLATAVPIQSIASATHSIQQDADGDRLARFSLTETKGGDRDFILTYGLSGDVIESGLSLYEKGSEKYFALVVEPPARVKPNEVPPREYVFVVDVSGSMHGYPLDTAKALLGKLARGLRPFDRFNVILFSGGSKLLAPRSVPATPANVEEALRIIDREQGGGGTELLPALQQALGLSEEVGLSRTFIVVTDGYIDADEAAMDLVRDNLGRANVFAFGIGSSVNRYLIEGLARAGAGEPFVITQETEAPAMAERFHRYIEAPVLTNVRVDFEKFGAHEVFPRSVPDVFARRPVVIHGKWRGPLQGNVTVRGSSGTGPFARRFDVGATSPRPENHALRYLWARTKIAELSDFTGEPAPADRAALVALGSHYNLLTRYTSFIAVLEQVRNPGAAATAVDQPLPLPAGVSELAVAEGIQGAPEPELWLLVVGAVLALLALGIATRTRGMLSCQR